VYLFIFSRYNEVCQDGVVLGGDELQSGTESFAQLVWKDTQKVGIAYATGKKKDQTCHYVVAVFRPPGNVENFYAENVLKGSFNLEKYCENV